MRTATLTVLETAATEAVIALDQATYVETMNAPLAEQRRTFREGRFGVSCGGVARYYQAILAEQGRLSFLVNFGPGSPVTHVAVLVPVNGDYHLHDPTFGLVFAGGLDAVKAETVWPETLDLSERRFVSVYASHPVLGALEPFGDRYGTTLGNRTMTGFQADLWGDAPRDWRIVPWLLRAGIINCEAHDI